MKAYADSSFIVALYLSQQSSPQAIGIMERHRKALPFTPWHRLEVRNAIRLAVCHKLIDAAQRKAQLRQLDSDLKNEMPLIHQPIDWTDTLRAADELGVSHNEAIGCRSADLFHVAAAIVMGCDTFLTFDQKQIATAKAAGLAVKP